MSLVTLVEVVLAAAVVFGIGVAATSALGSSEAVADEPPPPLPPVDAAELTAEDVARVRLPLAARGYRMADVDAVLDQLEQALAERDEELSRLRSAAASPVSDSPVSDSPVSASPVSASPVLESTGQVPPELESESPLWAEPVQQTQLYPEPEQPLPQQPYPDQIQSPPEQSPPEQEV